MELVDLVDAAGEPPLPAVPVAVRQRRAVRRWHDQGGAARDRAARLRDDEGHARRLREAIAAAWQAGAKKLKLTETIAFDAPEAGRVKPLAKGAKRAKAAKPATVAARLAAIRPRARPGADDQARAHEALAALRDGLFPPRRAWRPYPKVRPARLTDNQRALIKAAVAAEYSLDLALEGLFGHDAHLLRAIGATRPGPSDVAIKVGKETLPLWCAVSDVASGHLAPAPVLAAFRALPAAKALAAWNEIAGGDAYDLLEVIPLDMKESDIPRTAKKMARGAGRLYGWLADTSVALGEPGRKAAERLLDGLRSTTLARRRSSGWPRSRATPPPAARPSLPATT